MPAPSFLIKFIHCNLVELSKQEWSKHFRLWKLLYKLSSINIPGGFVDFKANFYSLEGQNWNLMVAHRPKAKTYCMGFYCISMYCFVKVQMGLQSQVPSANWPPDRTMLACGPHVGLPYRKVLSCMNVKVQLSHRNTYITGLLTVFISVSIDL